MRRLYLKIYLSFLAIIAAVAILAPLGWWMFGPPTEDTRIYDSLGKLAAKGLPPIAAPMGKQQQAINALARELDVRLSLYGPGRKLIASSGRPLPPPRENHGGWQFMRKIGPVIVLHLPDGRTLIAAHKHGKHAPFGPVLFILAIVVFSLGVYLLAKRLTGRLERLQSGVERFGEGDLSARVTIEGKDEIAELAKRFNHTAGHIEQLVKSQKNMLATASHELRTPLARLRMAVDLFATDPRPALKTELEQNIRELDRLIDEILLSSKLEANENHRPLEVLDLLGLLAEEASHYRANVGGESVMIEGEAHLLRRLLRNLLENAQRYGDATPVDAEVRHDEGYAILTVCDRGTGVPATERDRIFEPFYRPADVAEGSHGGVGLGLSLVRQIAERHGGSVTCLPREGGGSCFELRLPLDPSGL